MEDLIAQEDMVVTISRAGYIKRIAASTYRRQRRGGRGITGMGTKEDDWIERLYVANTHDYLLVYTESGQCHWLKVYEIPQGGRASRGRPALALRDHLSLTAIGLIGYYLASYLDFLGLQHITAGLERLILYLNPTMVLLLSVLFFGNALTRVDGIALLLAYGGIHGGAWIDVSIGDLDRVVIAEHFFDGRGQQGRFCP